MRTTDGSYEAHIKMLVRTFEFSVFAKFVPPYIIEEITDYRFYSSKTKGKVNLNEEWNDRCTTRHGYRTDVPGLFSEGLLATAYVIWHDVPWTDIKPYRSKEDQMVRKLDCRIAKVDYQCKSVRWLGDSLTLDPEWFKGEAERTALVDIDDKMIYVVRRQDVIDEFNGGNQKVSRNQIRAIMIEEFDFGKMYKRGDNI